MDRVFMEEYYQMKYQDTLFLRLKEQNEQCEKLYEKIMLLESQVEAAMMEKGEGFLKIHGKLFVAKGELDELVMRLAYLQGAADREAMLK